MIYTIPLTQGKVAVVSRRDFKELSQHKWFAAKCSGRFYAARNVPWPGGPRRQRTVFMHRVIKGLPDEIDVDHRDGDGLNNRRRNLRAAVDGGNNQNRGPSRNNRTGYRGVCRATKYPELYQASVHVGKKTIWLGYHNDPVGAAKAVDAKVKELHGKFAWLNFPETAAFCA